MKKLASYTTIVCSLWQEVALCVDVLRRRSPFCTLYWWCRITIFSGSMCQYSTIALILVAIPVTTIGRLYSKTLSLMADCMGLG